MKGEEKRENAKSADLKSKRKKIKNSSFFPSRSFFSGIDLI